MAGTSDDGGEYHQLDRSQRLLLNVMTTQMQRLLNRNNEELYARIEGLERQMNPNVGRPYGGNIRVNDEPNRMEGHNRIEAKQGDMLMMRRLLGSQMQPLDDTQRENIFHTRCTINGKLCSLIVNGESCTNVASSRLVSKLNLDTKPHPRPYRL